VSGCPSAYAVRDGGTIECVTLGRLVSACLAAFLVAGFVSAGAHPARTEAAKQGRDQVPPPGYKRLTNDRVGYTFLYPIGWKVAGKVVATEYAGTAACQSVRKVDSAPPADSGPGAGVRQSLVQVCWKPVDDLTLDGFMASTYGARLPSLFGRTRLAGVPAYRTTGTGASATYFLQSNAFRLQLQSSVVDDTAKDSLRSAQVRRIVSSFSLTRVR